MKTNVAQGLSVESEDSAAFAYEPPAELDTDELAGLGERFRQGVLESFDSEHDGIGQGQKAIYPATSLYLLAARDDGTRMQAVAALQKTFARALGRIYDPLEGGFFRYAETRDWQIPHYEKMADLNAGAVLVMLRLDEASPRPELAQAADKTLEYLRTTLYDSKLGVFLSFQEADTRYYALRSAAERGQVPAPAVSRNIFIDRLALTVTYLLDVLAFRPDPALAAEITSSLDFVARKLDADGALGRYYVIESATWSGKATLQDYALVARMFLAGAERLQAPRYRMHARRTADEAIARFRDRDLGVLADPALGDTDDAEFLMEVNGLLAQTLIGLEDSAAYGNLLDAIVTYFSAMGEVYDERVWEGDNWEFTERYVPYLRAVDGYIGELKLSARGQ